ncbi:MAG: DUF2066 domain-containing protein [Halioglobus sp.]|nr:DUF2066 domain-containing protein [Halioglobus sp.]
MRATRVTLMYLLLALLFAGNAWAEMVRDLHSASVPAANQGSKARKAAASEALAEVLVKVSGSRLLLADPIIVKALSNSETHVQQYVYTRNEPPALGFSVRFEFDRKYVTELVKQAGAPLWTASRPSVLAWVVVENENGRHFVDRDNWPEQAQILIDAFSRRGVPVQLPVFDLEDMSALSANDVWRLNSAAIQAASARYNAQDIIAGRLATVVEGESAGDWRYFYRDDRVNRSVSVDDLKAFMREGANIAASELSARYAVAPTTGEDGAMQMAVIGVFTYPEYAAIASWLDNLELIEDVIIEQVQGDRVRFRLQAQTDAEQLASIIELNEHLVRVPATELNPVLSYRWQR